MRTGAYMPLFLVKLETEINAKNEDEAMIHVIRRLAPDLFVTTDVRLARPRHLNRGSKKGRVTRPREKRASEK